MTSLMLRSPKSIAARAVAASVACCAMAVGLGTAAYAGEPQSRAGSRVASAGAEWNAPMARLGMPPRLPLEIDLHVLLIQSGQTAPEGPQADDTILVAVPLTAPQTLEEDIAKQYSLEIVERVDLSGMGLRIVQYRNAGRRTLSAVLSELRHDQRIRRAQRNAQYTLPNQSAPPAVSSNEKTPPAPQSPARHYADPKRAPVRSAQPATPRTVAHRPGIPAERPVVAVQAQPLPRAGSAGDVLSGGL